MHQIHLSHLFITHLSLNESKSTIWTLNILNPATFVPLNLSWRFYHSLSFFCHVLFAVSVYIFLLPYLNCSCPMLSVLCAYVSIQLPPWGSMKSILSYLMYESFLVHFRQRISTSLSFQQTKHLVTPYLWFKYHWNTTSTALYGFAFLFFLE